MYRTSPMIPPFPNLPPQIRWFASRIPVLLVGIGLAVFGILGCGKEPSGQGPGTSQAPDLPTNPAEVLERVQVDLVQSIDEAIFNQRQGALQDLFHTDSTHGFPIPGAGTAKQPGGLNLRLLEASDNSILSREDLARQWLAHFAGWEKGLTSEWTVLDIQSKDRSGHWSVDCLVRFRGTHLSGSPQCLRLEMNWSVSPDANGVLTIAALNVRRGLRGHATRPRYESASHWVGLVAPGRQASLTSPSTSPITATQRQNQRAGDELKSAAQSSGLLTAVGLTTMDWNQDGFEDVLMNRHGALSLLFLNDGKSGFEPGLLPLQVPKESPGFLLATDLDGDGQKELIGTRLLSFEGEFAYPGLYTRSHGGFWSLEERALALPIGKGNRRAVIHSITPADLDRDGLTDLIFAMGADGSRWNADSQRPEYDLPPEGQSNLVLRNMGNLRFEEMSLDLGLSGTASTRQIAVVDWNGDGLPDLYECNASPFLDRLWVAGQAGRFAEPIGWAAGDMYGHGDNHAAWALSLPGESAQSLLVLGQDHPATRIRAQAGAGSKQAEAAFAGNLWLQPRASGVADNVADALDLQHARRASTSVRLDVGNRGAYDLLIASSRPGSPGVQVYLDANRSNAAMEEVADLLGLADLPPVRACVPSDLDGDGDLDLLFACTDGSLHLMADTGSSGNFVRFDLKAAQGSATGAVLEVTTKSSVQSLVQRPVIGPSSQRSDSVHVGLGTHERIESVLVRWPSGKTTRHTELPVGGTLQILEEDQQGEDPESEAQPQAAIPHWPAPLAPDREAPQVGGYSRLLNGKNHPLGKAGVVNLMHFVAEVDLDQPWPWPALLERSGVDMELSLVVMDSDGWQGPQDGTLQAYSCDSAMRREFLGENSVLPSTFLFDAQGRLVRAISGTPTESTLRELFVLAHGDQALPEVLVREGFAALGDRKYSQALEAFAKAIEADPTRIDAYIGMGHTQRYLGNLDGSLMAISNAARSDPEFALTHLMLGNLQLSRGLGEKALSSFRKVLELQGGSPQVWFSMAKAASQAERWLEGLDAIERAIRLLETQSEGSAMLADAHCARGNLLVHLDEDAQALSAYKNALSIDARHPEALDCKNRILARIK